MKPAVPVALPADGSGIKFPTGTGDDGTEGAIKHKFELAQTEVTYELWKKVYDWANKGSNTCQASGQYCYTFANAGREGGIYDGSSYVPNSAANNKNPVTKVSWRDVIVWCNAYTEWYNATKGTSLSVVYYTDVAYATSLRTSTSGTVPNPLSNATAGSEDKPYIKAETNGNTDMAQNTATGFRLPTNAEWEFAARWQGTTDKGNSVSKVSDGTTYYFTKGNSASGATLPIGLNGLTLPTGKTWADLRDAAARVAVYDEWWDGTLGTPAWVDQTPATTSTASVGGKAANALGIYDMSGNVWEWCFDSSGSIRVFRGGSWYDNANYLQVGNVYNDSPDFASGDLGFRLARTQ